MSSYLNRKSIHEHDMHHSSPAKLHNSVGPRRLARSLLLSLSRKTGLSSDVASRNRESTSEPSLSDHNKPSVGGMASEDAAQALEPVQHLGGSSVASDDGGPTSTTSSDTGLLGKDGVGTISSLPLRQGQNGLNEDTAAPYKYLLVDDNDINLKILASFMKRLGHDYDTASNGLEALQMYTASPGLYPFVLMGKSTMANM